LGEEKWPRKNGPRFGHHEACDIPLGGKRMVKRPEREKSNQAGTQHIKRANFEGLVPTTISQKGIFA